MYQFLGYIIGLLYLASIGIIYDIYTHAQKDKITAHGDSWSQRFWISIQKPFLETSDSVFTWVSLKVRVIVAVLTCIPSFFIKAGTKTGDAAIWLSNFVYYYNFFLLFLFFLIFLRLFFPSLLFFLPKIKPNKQEMFTNLLFIILIFGFQILLVVLKIRLPSILRIGFCKFCGSDRQKRLFLQQIV